MSYFWSTDQSKQKKVTPQTTSLPRANLSRKFTYSNKDFEKISLQAFFSPGIRETMNIWEENESAPFQISEATLEAINNIKTRYPNIHSWDPRKILRRISPNWAIRNNLHARRNKETMKLVKKIEFTDRMEKNPYNNFTLQKQLDNGAMEDLIDGDKLNWGKASPITWYETEAPPIILDNIVESNNLSINAATMRIKGPSSDLRILTCHLDKTTGKWVESRRASHPFISVNMTKINPYRGNRSEGETKQLCVMADSGAMCTLLTFDTIRSMGIDPEKLETSTVSIPNTPNARQDRQPA